MKLDTHFPQREKSAVITRLKTGIQPPVYWHFIGFMPGKMRTWFVVVINLLLLGLAGLTWLLMNHHSRSHRHQVVEDYITFILLVFTFTTLVILLVNAFTKKRK